MIKVLFVAHDSGLFGAQRTLLTFLERVNRQRFECRVVVPSRGPFTEALESLGIPFDVKHMIRWVPEAARLQSRGRWPYLLQLTHGLRARAWAIAHLIQRHQIDLVYTNTVVCIEGAIAARMSRVPHLWHIHEPILGNPELGAVLPTALYGLAVRHLSDRVVFCSRSVASDYPRLAAKATVVLNGISVPAAVDRPEARKALGQKLNLKDSMRVVSIVGAIQPRKDHATFFAAAEKVAAMNGDVVFVVVGSGPDSLTAVLNEDVARRGLARVTHVLGWWPGPIHDILAASDVLVVSSIQESFGLAAMEALSVETPVVSTRCGGPQELLRDGIDGILVPVGAAQQMADAIIELLDDPAKARAYGQAGRESVLAKYSVERYVKGLEQVIERTVASSR
jgi:glycosyltransferase involved in cell wall biosynthesis